LNFGRNQESRIIENAVNAVRENRKRKEGKRECAKSLHWTLKTLLTNKKKKKKKKKKEHRGKPRRHKKRHRDQTQTPRQDEGRRGG